jgi:uncharacterized membrane protein HdeD (DUF308 family)
MKVFCLFFFMIMGIFFILAGLLYRAGMPLEDEWLLLVLFASCLIEYGYYLWVKEV